MGRNLKELKQLLDRRIGARDKLLGQISTSQAKTKNLRREHRDAEKAHLLIQTVGQQTQGELTYQLTELPKLALKGVFDDPYGFDIDFETRRSRTEADFWFTRDGAKIDPKGSTGLGAVDIAGTALRAALWSLSKPRNRASLWLDEPFKHLKGAEANRRALVMLKGICQPRPEQNWPGIQVIMIADERASREELLEASDRLFEFSIDKRITKVEMIEG